MKCMVCGVDGPGADLRCVPCAAELASPTASADQSVSRLPDPHPLPAASRPLDGERRRISVLFADIKDSTQLAVSLEPEDANLIVDDVIRSITEAVELHGGTVEQTRGDGVVALFGARLALEDHAVRACLAGLHMQQRMATLAESLDLRAGMPIRIRVGVNSGEGLVRATSPDLPRKYTADGPTTNIAAKLEEHARPGTVLVTSEVVRLVEGYIETRPGGSLRVAGARAGLDVYELVKVTSARSRFEAAAHRGLNDFVGRELEIAFLEKSAGLAEEGRGQALRILGLAGVGKTRLAWEFRRRLHASGWNVLASSSLARGTLRPYSVLVDILTTVFRLAPGDTSDRITTRIRQSCAPSRTESVDLSPVLALLGVATSDPEWDAIDVARRSARTREAVISILLREAARKPTLVSVEDVQWADRETCEFLDLLATRIESTRLVVLLEYRSEHESELARSRHFRDLRIESLPDSYAATLFRDLVGDSEGLGSLEKLILAQVVGNPFFLEEIVRMLVAEGTLVGSPRNYHAAKPISTIRIPASVSDVLAARIARLPERDREVAQAASVIGKEVPEAVLHQLCGLAPHDLSSALQHLVEAKLLAKIRTEPTAVFGFVHAFTHDVAYGSVHRTLRKQLHSRVLDILESLHFGSREHSELLAHHATSSERLGEAVIYLQRAARQAFDRSAIHETVRLLDDAIKTLDNATRLAGPLSSSRVASPVLKVDLLLDLRSALLSLGKLDRIEQVLREAEQLAVSSGDPTRQGKVAAYMCGHYWLTGDHRAAVQTGEHALRLAVSGGDQSLLIPTRTYVGAAYLNMGNNREAQKVLSENVRALSGGESPDQRFGMSGLPKVFALALRALSHADLGEFEEAILDAEEAMRIADAAGHGFSVQGASFGLGCLYLARGQLPPALEVLQRGLAISFAEKHRFWLPAIGPLAALVLAEQHCLEEAAELLSKTVRNLDDPKHGTFTVLTSAEVYLRVGGLEAAASLAEAALKQSRAKHECGFEARALWVLGEIESRREPPDSRVAETWYHDALVRATRLEMRPLAARCRLGLANTHSRSGSLEEARQELRLAREMHDQMGSLFWFERETQTFDD